MKTTLSKRTVDIPQSIESYQRCGCSCGRCSCVCNQFNTASNESGVAQGNATPYDAVVHRTASGLMTNPSLCTLW